MSGGSDFCQAGSRQNLFVMEDPPSFTPKHEDIDGDAFKTNGSEEDDIGYHSIGRNIKVRAAS